MNDASVLFDLSGHRSLAFVLNHLKETAVAVERSTAFFGEPERSTVLLALLKAKQENPDTSLDLLIAKLEAERKAQSRSWR